MNKSSFYILFIVAGSWLWACQPSPASNKAVAAAISVSAGNNDTLHWPASFGIGRVAIQAEIDSMDIDVGPDGRGLPIGSGTAMAGKAVYALKCAACHGASGTEGPQNRLVGAMGDTTKAKTIGNYWPYATTLFDYIRRAMPYNAPGSLTNAEVYDITAFLLHANKIIDASTVINAHNLPLVQMPARPLFVNDDRQGGPEIR